MKEKIEITLENLNDFLIPDKQHGGLRLNTNKTKYAIIPDEYNWCKGFGEYRFVLENKLTEPGKCAHPNCDNFCKFCYASDTGYKKHCSCKCSTTNPNVVKKFKKTMIKKYGVEHPTYSKKIMKQTQNTNLKKYGVKWNITTTRVKQENTKIKNKLAKFYEGFETDLAFYKRQVRNFTNKANIKLLKNYCQRGKNEDKNTYQLDHIISIMYGFQNNILPNIIGNINNLQMLKASENASKREQCYSVISQCDHLQV